MLKFMESSSTSAAAADRLVIEALDIGEILYVEAPREKVYVCGRSMAKADLAYLFENGN